MTKQQFKVTIAAPRERVWKELWDDQSYREWTSVFAPGSKAVTDWKQGSKILFVDGENSGMVSRVQERRDNEFMSIFHFGLVKDGVEIVDTPDSKDWEGYENYTLRGSNGQTEVIVDLSYGKQEDNIVDMFEKLFPKALQKLKEIAER